MEVMMIKGFPSFFSNLSSVLVFHFYTFETFWVGFFFYNAHCCLLRCPAILSYTDFISYMLAPAPEKKFTKKFYNFFQSS